MRENKCTFCMGSGLQVGGGSIMEKCNNCFDGSPVEIVKQPEVELTLQQVSVINKNRSKKEPVSILVNNSVKKKKKVKVRHKEVKQNEVITHVVVIEEPKIGFFRRGVKKLFRL